MYNSTLAFVDALSSVNLSYVEDLNTGIVSGATRCTMTEKNGARVSAYDAYYVRVQERENLHVVTYGQVQRINFGGKGRNVTATGVTFTDQSSGITRNVTASKEVLLCAGAIQSPHLMMISVSRDCSRLEEPDIETLRGSDRLNSLNSKVSRLMLRTRTSVSGELSHIDSM